jgi:hypothetical protein
MAVPSVPPRTRDWFEPKNTSDSSAHSITWGRVRLKARPEIPWLTNVSSVVDCSRTMFVRAGQRLLKIRLAAQNMFSTVFSRLNNTVLNEDF